MSLCEKCFSFEFRFPNISFRKKISERFINSSADMGVRWGSYFG